MAREFHDPVIDLDYADAGSFEALEVEQALILMNRRVPDLNDLATAFATFLTKKKWRSARPVFQTTINKWIEVRNNPDLNMPADPTQDDPKIVGPELRKRFFEKYTAWIKSLKSA